MRASAVVFVLLAWPLRAGATDLNADPGTYHDVLGQLGPGDRMILSPGEYPGLPIDGLDGTEQRPIVITGPETGAPAVITGRACCNTISIRNSSYLVISHLSVDVRGELVDGLKAEGDATYAHHITIEHLTLYGFGQDQQIVGINTKCPAWDWIIRYNTITGAGTGLYLGDSTGGQPFVEGVIEYNLVVNPIGYDMEIKHQIDRPAGLGIPTDAVTIIRHNVFIKAENASTGTEGRPNLLVGHFPPNGDGSSDRYQIYGNFFFENQTGTEALFQGEGRFTFHDNILVNTFGAGMYVQPQNGEVKDVDIYHNTFFVTDSAAEIYGGGGYTQNVVANAIFSGTGTPLSGGAQRDNVTAPLAMAGAYVGEPTPMLGVLDLYPSGGALSGAAVDLSDFGGDLDVDHDFNGTARDGTWRGAYSGSGSNPGWMLAEEIKTLMPGMNPAPDAGFDDAGRPIDAGATADAGFDDAGRPIDAGMTPAGDAGLDPKDAQPGTRGHTAGGCGCSSTERAGGNRAPLLVFAGLLLLVRRRVGRIT